MPRKKMLTALKDLFIEPSVLIKEKETLKPSTEQLPDLSQIELLMHLQQIDRELYGVHKRLVFLNQSALKAKARLVKLKLKRTRIVQLQLRAKKKFTSLRNRIKKVKSLLATPTTRDRSVLTSKLKQLRADKLRFKEELQRLEAKRVKVRNRYRKIRDKLKTWIEERKKIRQLSKARRDILEAQRRVLRNLVEPYLIRAYEKLLARYDGQAVVNVAEGVCQGCHTMVPSCVVSSLVGKRIVNCEGCQRFLYFVPTPLEPVFDLKVLSVDEPRKVRTY